MRFVWIVGIVAAVGIVGCKDKHHNADLVVTGSSMTTDATGVTTIDGDVLNQSGKDMTTTVTITFGVYQGKNQLGMATTQTGNLPNGQTWTFHASAGKVGTPDWYQLLNLQGF